MSDIVKGMVQLRVGVREDMESHHMAGGQTPGKHLPGAAV